MKRYVLTAILLMLLARVWAQQEASFAHYWALEPQFNPAVVGKQPVLNATAAYNMSMVGFEHNPRTMYAAADMPFRTGNVVHGVGIQLLNDDIGLFSHKRILLQYALKQRLLGGTLSIGVQGGLLSEAFKGSELDLENASDPAFVTTDVSGVGLDLSAGLYYTRGPWYLGASVLHLTAPSIELGERSVLDISRAYYFTAGYNIRLRNPFFTIHPSVLASTDGTTTRVDLTARVRYTNDRRMLYAGVGYSPTNSVTAMVGGTFHGVCLGYAYEMYTTGTGLGRGSHELFVGYQTEIDLSKKSKARHQSVRFL